MVPAYANEGSLRVQPIKVQLCFSGPWPCISRSSRDKGRGVMLMECKARWDFVGNHIYSVPYFLTLDRNLRYPRPLS